MIRALSAVVALAAALYVGAAPSDPIVTRVIDGETLAIRGVGVVRLVGIRSRNTAEGRLFLLRLVNEQPVHLEYEGGPDAKGVFHAYVYLANGTLVNRELIAKGHARVDVSVPFRFQAGFLALEASRTTAGASSK